MRERVHATISYCRSRDEYKVHSVNCIVYGVGKHHFRPLECAHHRSEDCNDGACQDDQFIAYWIASDDAVIAVYVHGNIQQTLDVG